MRDKKTLLVGQEVRINGGGGFGPTDGKIVKISPPCIYVETGMGRFRFNSEGKECGPDGQAYDDYESSLDTPGPWELVG